MIRSLAKKVSLAGRRLLLSAIAMVAIAGSVVFGVLRFPQVRAQSAQAAGEPLPSFEVASIKLCRERENSHLAILPNRLTVRNQPIEFLIKLAYGQDLGEFGFRMLRDKQLVGGPDWLYGHISGYDGYDVDAKVEESLAGKFVKLHCGSFFSRACGYREQMILMLQSLLAERFKLKVRRETKELSVYALVTAKGGPKFLHAKFETSDDPAHRSDPMLPPPAPPAMPQRRIVLAQLWVHGSDGGYTFPDVGNRPPGIGPNRPQGRLLPRSAICITAPNTHCANRQHLTAWTRGALDFYRASATARFEAEAHEGASGVHRHRTY